MVEYDLGKVVGDKGDTGNGIASITLHSTSGKVKTYRITYTDESTFDFQVRDGSDASVTVDSALSSSSTNPVQNKVIKGALDGKSDTGHTHTKSNITDFAHTHDDRYYTESETDTLLSGKASSSHTHKKLEKTEITTGNLNDYTDTGWYSYSSGNSANITNVPEVVGSVMEVLDDYGDGRYVIQKVYTLPSTRDSVVWYRQKYHVNGWGSWKKLMSDSDIVDNLTTNDATKVLSAKQGYQLNQLIGQAISYINQ